MSKTPSITLRALAGRLTSLDLPDGRKYDCDTPGGRDGYLDEWRRIKNDGDDLLEDSIRFAATTDSAKHRAAANKLARHLAKLTELAPEVVALHDRAANFLQKSDPSLVEIAWEFFVSKTPRTKWAEKEHRAIGALTKKQKGQYMKLLRERELLQIHLRALTE